MVRQKGLRRSLRTSVYRIGLASLVALRWYRLFTLRALRVENVSPRNVQQLEEFQSVQNWFVSEVETCSHLVLPRGEFSPTLGFSCVNTASVCANPRYSGVIYKNRFLLEPSGQPTPPQLTVSDPSVSGLLYSYGPTLLAKVTHETAVERAIYIGSKSPNNWYHWIIDTLPSVFLSRLLPADFNDVPLLIPTAVLNRPHWMEMLAIANPGRELKPLARNRYLRVSELVWLHSPTIRGEVEPGNRTTLFAMERLSMLSYRAHMLDHFSPRFSGKVESKRIFLARDQSGLRPYNQEEILKVADEFGFTPIYLESMDLCESVETIAKAEYIIGPHGAAWASAIFATSARAALIWTWNQARNENWFHNVLTLQQIPYRTIFTGPGSNSSSYSLSTKKFRKALDQLLRENET